MVDALTALAAELARFAHEVGAQGVLGSQARVERALGAWADLSLGVKVRVNQYSSAPADPLRRN
jgi:hypothetical protein